MSFLAPFYLVLAGAIAVPLLIHLLRRRIGARIEFPAARYLARAEREHSRTLRIRNLLLMMLRILALLALVIAAARPVARWVGAGHGPTAMAIVIDNSMSAGVIVNGRPLLDQFKAMAARVVSQAASTDRVWLVTADGLVRGGTPALIRDDIQRLEPLAGAGDPPQALARAANLVRAAPLEGKQVALLTDGQRNAWRRTVPLGEVSVLAWVAPGTPPLNRAVISAAARPVRWTPRGAVVTRFLSPDSTSYRMTLAGRTFARGTAAPNEEVTVRAAPPDRGWVAGTVELEPDELPADNVRHFAVWIGPAPGVDVSKGAGPFLENGVDVLRTTEAVVVGHDIAVVSADELTAIPALITAPADPVRLGVANRALERAGIPWRFGVPRAGEAVARGAGLDQVTVTLRYALLPQGAAPAETLAVVGQDAWIVAGPRYVLIASPILPEATGLPVRAAFIPWLGATLTERLVGEPGQVIDAAPSSRIPRPRWADGLEAPDGSRTPLAEVIDVPPRAGTYFFTRAERRVGALVVNAPAEESILDRYAPAELAARLQAQRVLTAPDADAWNALAFRAASHRSLIEPALLVALAALGVEAVVIGLRARRAA